MALCYAKYGGINFKKMSWRISRVQEEILGAFHHLVKDVRIYETEYFFNCLRMTPAMLKELCKLLGLHPQKRDTPFSLLWIVVANEVIHEN